MAWQSTVAGWCGQALVVFDKQEKVHMTSCSVGISCDKSSPDYYDLTLPWDVHLTYSGTYVHYLTGDPNPGGYADFNLEWDQWLGGSASGEETAATL